VGAHARTTSRTPSVRNEPSLLLVEWSHAPAPGSLTSLAVDVGIGCGSVAIPAPSPPARPSARGRARDRATGLDHDVPMCCVSSVPRGDFPTNGAQPSLCGLRTASFPLGGETGSKVECAVRIARTTCCLSGAGLLHDAHGPRSRDPLRRRAAVDVGAERRSSPASGLARQRRVSRYALNDLVARTRSSGRSGTRSGVAISGGGRTALPGNG